MSLDDPTNLSQIRADVDTLDNFPIMYTKSYNSDLFWSHKCRVLDGELLYT